MNTIRISCGALCRIQITGSQLVEVNKNRGNILTPIGGAIEFKEVARTILNAMHASFEKGNDLRLVLPTEYLPRFDAWFRSRKDRELSPLRELAEELHDEHHVTNLGDLQGLTQCEYLYTCTSQAETTRKGCEGVLTMYYHEVFAVQLPTQAEHAILDAIKREASRLRFISETELSVRKSQDGFPLAKTVYCLFNNRALD